MFKKILATGLLAVLAVFAVPAAANAYEVTDGSDVTVGCCWNSEHRENCE